MKKQYCCCRAVIACYILGAAYIAGLVYLAVTLSISIVNYPTYWMGSQLGWWSRIIFVLQFIGLITTPLMMLGVRNNKEMPLNFSLVQLVVCFLLNVIFNIIRFSHTREYTYTWIRGYNSIVFDLSSWNTYVGIFFLLIEPALIHAEFIVRKQIRDPQQEQQATRETITVPTNSVQAFGSSESLMPSNFLDNCSQEDRISSSSIQHCTITESGKKDLPPPYEMAILM